MRSHQPGLCHALAAGEALCQVGAPDDDGLPPE
jgi:hypothetical protein